jgi:hypothetical protein
MGQGYAEGPAVEAAEEARERREHPAPPKPTRRRAVLGCTPQNPEPHILGWADEIDQDALFEAGDAWGIRLVLRDEGP